MRTKGVMTMYDVQVMLEEAIEKTKDIEVCGMKNILSEYLQYNIMEYALNNKWLCPIEKEYIED